MSACHRYSIYWYQHLLKTFCFNTEKGCLVWCPDSSVGMLTLVNWGFYPSLSSLFLSSLYRLIKDH